MKKLLLIVFSALAVLVVKAQGQIPVTFSTNFTDANISLIVGDNSVESLVSIIEHNGIYLVYGVSEADFKEIKIPLTRVGESLTYSSAAVNLERNTLYEYYFMIGTDGYFMEGSFGDIARLSPGYYRFLYTNTSADALALEPLTFNGTAPAGKKALRVKVDMTGTTVSSNGIFAISGSTITPLVNISTALEETDNHIYEGLLYASSGTDVTYTFYNGTIPEDQLINNNTYTTTLNSDTEKDAAKFSTEDIYEAAKHELYDPNYIQRIEIKFAEDNWDALLCYNKDNAGAADVDEFLQSEWVKINGVTLEGAAVKYKGNSSYSSGRAKNPFNISLDEFAEFADNKYQGYTTLKLANVFGDPSFVREVLSYEILNNYMESGKANFAQVYVNGKYLGLYTNTEAVNKSFCTRHFGSKKNTFVDCSPISSPTLDTKSNLKYTSDNESDYNQSYELKVGTWERFIELCNTVTNNPTELDKILDIDKFLWYLAFSNIAVNLDSYAGVYSQNYYLYESSEGRFMAIPWDFNMSFGGFNNIGTGNRHSQLDLTQRQQLALNLHSTDSYWPVIKAVYANEQWKKMYLAHCKTIYKDYFENDAYLQSIAKWQAVAEQSVGADTNKFYSLDKFHTGLTEDYSVNGYSVNGIKTLMDPRKIYLSGLSEFTSTQPSLSNQSANEFNFTIAADNASNVYLYYRIKGDGNGAFTAVEMTNSGNTYSATIPAQEDVFEYYFYAENSTIGAFLPTNAAHEFYTHDMSSTNNDAEKYWIKDDFSTYATESDYIKAATQRTTLPNSIELTSVYTNFETQSGACGTGNGLRIRGAKDGGYVEFTVPNMNSTTISVKAKSSTADRTVTIYKNGVLAQTFEGLDADHCEIYTDTEVSSTSVTYKISGGDAASTNPVIISSIIVEKYSDGSGISQLKSTSLKMYPNPASNIVTISGCEAGDFIAVYNLFGNMIYKNKATGGQYTISVENWADGIYILKCGTQSYKLIVKH